MQARFWTLVPLGPALLTACGTSGGGGGASVSGVVALPGALSGSTSASVPAGTLALKSWWTGPAASRPTRSGEAIPGQYIVRLRPSLSTQSLTQLPVSGQALKQSAAIPELGIGYYHAVNTLDAAGC